jgi:hypothetical protein
MRVILLPALGAAMMLVACSQEDEAPAEAAMEEAAPDNQYGFTDASSAPPARAVTADVSSSPSDPASTLPALEVGQGVPLPDAGDMGSLPKIAYVYDYGFRLAADAIAPLQQRHADLCEAKGPNVCRILSLEHSGPEGEYVHGTLQLAVATSQARKFGAELATAATEAEGEQISTTIEGEDLSKQIVDTEARLRARTVLRDRLLETLRTRKGSVSELVEAERHVAAVNEEIDRATSWLAEMRGRVAFSRMNVNYESGLPSSGSFMDPIRESFGNVGSILGAFIGVLILVLTVGVPILLLVLAVRFGWRRMGLAAPKPADGAA